jgi:hypothetical protein|tara:strand:- start:652 stop:1062 length:411 start_codon:yes stop_codon:yes gene_type:complete
MTSQLNVDTIVDKAGSGGSNVKMANTSTYVADGGSATQNTVQSLVKVWAKFNGSSFGELDSFNVSSFTDSGAGNYTVNINNDFSNANHASVEGSGAYHTVNDAANAAGTLNLACYNSSHSNADESRVAVHSCGDLA